MTQKVATTSDYIPNENLLKLRAVFPQFVKDGQIDFDALSAFFDRENILAGSEKYGLSWARKSDAFKAIRVPATGTLVPDQRGVGEWDETQNIFIEGDNLEVLKLLQKHYREQIKMIYIDPPYNTGKDFIYRDNFTENRNDYYERTGQSEGGVKLTSNPESAGRYHSDWLTMMYPRLFLAKNLLKDDGVIFISIDDNEVANLRLIMDDIFGEENLLAQLIHQRAKGGGQAKQVVKGHDYILAYARNADGGIALRRAKVVQQDVVIRDGKEYLRNDDVVRKTFGKYDKSLGDRRCFYEELEQYKGLEKKKEIDERVARGELVLEKQNGDTVIVEYVLLDEASSKLYSIIKVLSEEGKNDLEDLGIKGFDYPKPVELVRQIIQSATLSSKNDGEIILDFFAGSGTTAHAVMAQNAEDGGNRKWICVQIPEETAEDSEARKVGFNTIADISRERIRRASAWLKDNKVVDRDIHEDPPGMKRLFDGGFKSLALAPSNYRQWNVLTEKDDEAKLKAQMKLFADKPLVDGASEESVVYEILLKEGFSLSSHIKKPDRGSAIPLWVVVDTGVRSKKMFITFADKITREGLANQGVGETDNEIFVCLDSALDDSLKVNLSKNFSLKVI